jgi:hypothetical protein
MWIVAILFFGIAPVHGQELHKNDVGTLGLHGGSILLFNSASVIYESPDLFKKSEAQDLRVSLGYGIWYFEFLSRARGALGYGGLELILGPNEHHLEIDLGVMMRSFDESFSDNTEGQTVFLPRSFIGYRYESADSPVYLKAGIGFVELLQFGFGVRLISK